jgi:Ca2+-binding EF-hand superfamily protein
VNVHTLDNETVQNLTQQFNAADTTGCGKLSNAEINVLIKNSYAPKEEELANIFRHLNANKDEAVQFDEFVFAFYRLNVAVNGDKQTADLDFDLTYQEFASELNHIAKQGKPQAAMDIEFTPEACAAAREFMGEDWITKLRQKFVACSPDGDTDSLPASDMEALLKATFTPSEDKIAKVMLFFDMSGEGDGITLANFINGMTLLYGDLGHLAASPKQRKSPISPCSPPAGEYAGSPGDFTLASSP